MMGYLWLYPNNGLLRVGALPAAKTLVLATGPLDALRALMRERGERLDQREFRLRVQDNAEAVADEFRRSLETQPVPGINPTRKRFARRRAA